MIELVASIVGLASAGTKLSLVLYQISADVGSAGQEARVLGQDIENFCIVLELLQKTLDGSATSASLAGCSEIFSDMQVHFARIFKEILTAIEELEPWAARSRAAVFKYRYRIQWVFQRRRVEYLKAIINGYKDTINMMLGTLSLANAARPKRYVSSFCFLPLWQDYQR